MRGLHRISTNQELQRFVDLWTQLHEVQLQSQEDEVSWRLGASGQANTLPSRRTTVSLLGHSQN